MSELRERLAALAHEQWSGWMRYLFEKTVYMNGEVTIPDWAVERWRRQARTPYAQLSDEEQESDRKEADRVLELVGARVTELELVLNELHACILAGADIGAITDTLWVGPGRTAVDAIEHALRLERNN